MRSIKNSYVSVRDALPYEYSSYLCFARAIKSRGFSNKSIAKWFNTLVEKEDYDQKDRKGIVNFLQKFSVIPVQGDF